MNTNRMNQIIQTLEGLGTDPNTLYTNQEIVNHLTELQGAMARGVFEKTHAENLRERDIMIHFEALAKEYELDSTDTYLRFKENMNELGYTIGSFIKGMNGERIARRALKLLTYDKSIRILYNVQLEDEDVQAEYDAIVVAPFGIFVVEVKNWGVSMTISSNGLLTRDDDSNIVYDLPGRMSVKEALLREHLRELFPSNYHNMLLISNERAHIKDNYHRISISCGGGIAYEIKSYANSGETISCEQVNKIADAILESHKEQRALCSVKCDEIITDYAKLMVQIEAASTGCSEEYINDTEIPAEERIINVTMPKASPWYHRIDWLSIAAGVVALAIPVVASTMVKYKR